MSNSNISSASNAEFVTFEKTDLYVINRDGSVWLSAADLSRALGYKNAHAVSKVYDRNSHEFTGDMTQVITLQANEINVTPKLGVTPAHGKTVRIFSSRGCHLIAMLSRTEKAGMFRRWVLDVLENLNKPTIAPATPKQVLPSYLQNNHGRTLFKDAVTSSAYSMLVRGNFEEEQRYMSEQVNKRVASRMEDIACHEYEGLRLLMESDGIGGFDTKQIMPGIHLLENKQLAEHILSAKGPLSRYIPAIMQACAQRMQDVCDMPLAGVDIEGLNL